MLRAVAQKGMRGVYYDTRTLLSAIRSTYNPVTCRSEAEILDEVMGAELLVLDDLGAERVTAWVEETMHLVVNTRYNEKRPTVFTTNYEDVADVEDLDSLLVRVGRRLHSRLREMCEFLEYDGADYRGVPGSADVGVPAPELEAGFRPARAAANPGARRGREGSVRRGLAWRQGRYLTRPHHSRRELQRHGRRRAAGLASVGGGAEPARRRGPAWGCGRSGPAQLAPAEPDRGALDAGDVLGWLEFGGGGRATSCAWRWKT